MLWLALSISGNFYVASKPSRPPSSVTLAALAKKAVVKLSAAELISSYILIDPRMADGHTDLVAHAADLFRGSTPTTTSAQRSRSCLVAPCTYQSSAFAAVSKHESVPGHIAFPARYVSTPDKLWSDEHGRFWQRMKVEGLGQSGWRFGIASPQPTADNS